jgi:hypothetical protein
VLGTLAALLLAGVALAPSTAEVMTRPVHCKTGFVRRVEHKHKHGRLVTVVACAKVETTLHVTLDPTFTQDGLTATISYSASATIGHQLDPNLPAGVLELFSDGRLECSEKVGGRTHDGYCPVTFGIYGDHTVTIVYISGTHRGTTGPQTITLTAPPATVPPAGPLPTTTTELVTLVGCMQADGMIQGYEGPVETCDYTANATAAGTPPKKAVE